MNHVLLAAIDVLADDGPRRTGPDFGKASPLGLLIVVLLLLGTFLLIRSMNRHLKKLPDSFDRDNPGPDQAVDEGTAEVDQPGDRNGTAHEPDG